MRGRRQRKMWIRENICLQVELNCELLRGRGGNTTIVKLREKYTWHVYRKYMLRKLVIKKRKKKKRKRKRQRLARSEKQIQITRKCIVL